MNFHHSDSPGFPQMMIMIKYSSKTAQTAAFSGDCLELTGYSSEELSGTRDFFSILFDESGKQLIGNCLNTVLENFSCKPIELLLKHKNDQARLVLCSFFFNPEKENNEANISILLQDLTDIRKMTARLQDSLVFRQKAFSCSPIPIIIMDTETHKFIDCNQAAVDIYKFPDRESVIGKTPLEVSASIQYDGTPSREKAEYYIKLGRTRGSVVFEWSHQRPNGELWDAEVHLLSFFSEKKELMQFSLLDITEEKRAKRELIKEKERLKKILQASPVGLLLMDRDRMINESNYAMTTMVMRDPSEIIGLRAGNAIGCINSASDSRGCGFGKSCPECILRKTIEKVVAENEVLHNIEVSLDLLVGGKIEKRWLKIDAAPIDLPGETQIIVAVHDITEQRLSEQKLQESLERFRVIFSDSPDAFLVLSEGKFIDCNHSAENMLGASRDEIVGHPPDDISPEFQPDGSLSSESAAKKIAECNEKGTNRFEWIHKKRNGEEFPVEVSLALTVLNGKLIQLVAWRDISERKNAESNLKIFKETVENSTDAIGMSTPEGKHYYQNRAFNELFGNIGENPPETLYVNKEQGYEIFKTIMSGGQWSGEIQMYGRNRQILNILLRAYSNKDESGKISALVGIHTDVTEQRKAIEEQAKLQEQLNHSQKIESVGRLAGGIAHDFNNMLSVIIGHSELALGYPDKSEKVSVDLKEIFKAAERSAQLTRQLLAFARKQTATPVPMDLNEVVEGMLKMLRRLIGENIELTWLPGNSIGQIKMDPSQVDQIMANLCVNAKDAIAGNGLICIKTESTVLGAEQCSEIPDGIPGRYIMLSVQDSGCGIKADILPHLFEPFFTTKESGKGTGLGLAIVYGIVKQNNGLIKVISSEEHGTTFEIYLPEHEEQKVQTSQSEQIAAESNSFATILLVEDELSVLEMTRRMLEIQGHSVIPCSSPEMALKAVQEQPAKIDLLITDVIMPEMNGRDLATKIKKYSRI